MSAQRATPARSVTLPPSAVRAGRSPPPVGTRAAPCWPAASGRCLPSSGPGEHPQALPPGLGGCTRSTLWCAWGNACLARAWRLEAPPAHSPLSVRLSQRAHQASGRDWHHRDPAALFRWKGRRHALLLRGSRSPDSKQPEVGAAESKAAASPSSSPQGHPSPPPLRESQALQGPSGNSALGHPPTSCRDLHQQLDSGSGETSGPHLPRSQLPEA